MCRCKSKWALTWLIFVFLEFYEMLLMAEQKAEWHLIHKVPMLWKPGGPWTLASGSADTFCFNFKWISTSPIRKRTLQISFPEWLDSLLVELQSIIQRLNQQWFTKAHPQTEWVKTWSCHTNSDTGLDVSLFKNKPKNMGVCWAGCDEVLLVQWKTSFISVQLEFFVQLKLVPSRSHRS